jgi:hypothetical protein
MSRETGMKGIIWPESDPMYKAFLKGYTVRDWGKLDRIVREKSMLKEKEYNKDR